MTGPGCEWIYSMCSDTVVVLFRTATCFIVILFASLPGFLFIYFYALQMDNTACNGPPMLLVLVCGSCM